MTTNLKSTSFNEEAQDTPGSNSSSLFVQMFFKSLIISFVCREILSLNMSFRSLMVTNLFTMVSFWHTIVCATSSTTGHWNRHFYYYWICKGHIWVALQHLSLFQEQFSLYLGSILIIQFCILKYEIFTSIQTLIELGGCSCWHSCYCSSAAQTTTVKTTTPLTAPSHPYSSSLTIGLNGPKSTNTNTKKYKSKYNYKKKYKYTS